VTALVLALLVAFPLWLRLVSTRDRTTVLEVLSFGVTTGAALGLLGMVLT
jgi:hypothetical protein